MQCIEACIATTHPPTHTHLIACLFLHVGHLSALWSLPLPLLTARDMTPVHDPTSWSWPAGSASQGSSHSAAPWHPLPPTVKMNLHLFCVICFYNSEHEVCGARITIHCSILSGAIGSMHAALPISYIVIIIAILLYKLYTKPLASLRNTDVVENGGWRNVLQFYREIRGFKEPTCSCTRENF